MPRRAEQRACRPAFSERVGWAVDRAGHGVETLLWSQRTCEKHMGRCSAAAARARRCAAAVRGPAVAAAGPRHWEWAAQHLQGSILLSMLRAALSTECTSAAPVLNASPGPGGIRAVPFPPTRRARCALQPRACSLGTPARDLHKIWTCSAARWARDHTKRALMRLAIVGRSAAAEAADDNAGWWSRGNWWRPGWWRRPAVATAAAAVPPPPPAASEPAPARPRPPTPPPPDPVTLLEWHGALGCSGPV